MDAQQSAEALTRLTYIQEKVDDLEKRALTPEQLDALVGPDDGLYAALNDRFAKLDAKLDALAKKLG